MVAILKDRVSSVLKGYKAVNLSSSDINNVNNSVNKDMNNSKILFNKREQQSIEYASKIILNR